MSDPVPPTMPPDSKGGACGDPASDAPPTIADGERTPSPPPAPSGRTFGRYTLLEKIGQGGMGVVWKALDTQLTRVVALKQVLPGGAASPQDLERFLREARLTARLRHPHIVPVYDAGAFEGQPYYTAEFIEGRPLCDLVKQPLAPHEVARIMQSIAEALAYAHSQGVVHRDVKPGNILVAPDGRAWLTDFGLAKQLRAEDAPVQADLTVQGAILGTPHYMSPEQASGAGDVGPASDQFSLAVVMYEALTGRRPFGGSTPFEVACDVVSREPDPLRSVKPQIHPDLETICMRCLEKSPERRYPSAGEFAADLARHLRGEPIEARPVSTIVRLARKVRANRFAVLSALALVLVLGIAAYAFSQRTRSRDDLAAAQAAGRAAEEEGRRQQEAVRKSALVAGVVSRWLALKDVLTQIQRVAIDPTLDPSTRRALSERHWADVDRFMKETPDDPTSRATMLALAGWAKVLSGDRKGGVDWMDEARALDPDVPYGAGMKATSRLLRFAFEDIPDLLKQGGGVAFVRERARVRQEVAPLLEEARRASVWGGELAEQVETMLAIIDALATGNLSEADRLIGGVQLFPGMQPMTGHLSRLRGDIRRRVGDRAGAVERYTEAIRANRFLPGVFAERGWVKHELGDCTGAAEDFTEALAISARDVNALRGRGWAKIALGEPKGAVEDFTLALEVRPGDDQALRGRAWAKIALADWQGAVDDFTAALATSPGDVEALSGRASARLALGDRKGAIGDYSESLAIRPRDAQVLLARARARGEEGDGERELADCDEAVRIAPEMTAARLQRGGARLRRGDAKGAAADLDSVVAETPQDLAAWNLLIAARQAAGDHRGVIAACDGALALDPENAGTYEARAYAKKQSGEIDAAISDYDRAIGLRPAYPEAFNNRGRARYAKKDLDGALADYEEAIRLRPDYVEAIGNRGRAREAKGDVAGAIEDYDQALRIAPADWPHRALLEKVRAEALQKR